MFTKVSSLYGKTGLVNRIVPVGEGLNESIKLANHIASFPQSSLLHDYNSSIRSTNISHDLLRNEYESAKALLNEAVEGAQKFSQGTGRSGK